MEVGDGLAEGVRDVRELGLEAAECLAGVVGIFGGDGLEGEGVRDEHGDAPVGFAVGPVGLGGILQGHEAEHLAVEIGLAGDLQLGADVAGDRLDVVLEEFHVLEDGVVDALEHIVFRPVRGNLKSIVDESVAEGLYLFDVTLDGEFACDGCEFLLSFHLIRLLVLRR